CARLRRKGRPRRADPQARERVRRGDGVERGPQRSPQAKRPALRPASGTPIARLNRAIRQSRRPDSNLGPLHYERSAIPTEIRRQKTLQIRNLPATGEKRLFRDK